MQNLSRMHMVIFKNYFQMKKINENVNWMKLTHLLFNFLQTSSLFLYIYLCFKNFFKNVYTRRKWHLSLMYIMHTNYLK